jgi:hypothetical protein
MDRAKAPITKGAGVLESCLAGRLLVDVTVHACAAEQSWTVRFDWVEDELARILVDK